MAKRVEIQREQARLARDIERIDREALRPPVRQPLTGGATAVAFGVVADIQDGLKYVVGVRRVAAGEAVGEYTFVGDVEFVKTWPTSLVSGDYAAVLFQAETLDSRANVLPILLIDGEWYAQLAPRFKLAKLDPGVRVTDCFLAAPAPSQGVPASVTSDDPATGEAAGGAGVTDHGALYGLGDDDHPQYHTNARGDARYAPIGEGAVVSVGGTAAFTFVASEGFAI